MSLFFSDEQELPLTDEIIRNRKIEKDYSVIFTERRSKILTALVLKPDILLLTKRSDSS
jgi:hypothetical protein